MTLLSWEVSRKISRTLVKFKLRISDANGYPKTLGIEWNVSTDQFRLTVADLPPSNEATKGVVVSDVAKVFDVLGWFSPVTIKMKILLQRLWKIVADWTVQ